MNCYLVVKSIMLFNSYLNREKLKCWNESCIRLDCWAVCLASLSNIFFHHILAQLFPPSPTTVCQHPCSPAPCIPWMTLKKLENHWLSLLLHCRSSGSCMCEELVLVCPVGLDRQLLSGLFSGKAPWYSGRVVCLEVIYQDICWMVTTAWEREK